MRTCAGADVPLFHFSGTVGRIAPKFGVWLETYQLFYNSLGLGTYAWARADVPAFPYLGSSQTDCAEIWYVVREPMAGCFTKFYVGVQLHVRTCAPLFHISETA